MRNHLEAQALVAALILALATTTGAQEKPADGPSEGIKVHGHWTIEIRNSDGSLASRSEFENSLQVTGKASLAFVLGRLRAVGDWTIVIHDGQTGDYLRGGPCETDVIGPLLPVQCSRLADVNLPIDPNSGLPVAVDLKPGTIAAAHDSVIRGVECIISLQAFGSTEPPIGWLFSAKTFGPTEERSVLEGQIIQVTVVFSFS